MHTVIFELEGAEAVRVSAEAGETLMEAAVRAGVAIDAPCSGRGSCGKCRVRVTRGSVDSENARNITPAEWDAGWRLSCSARITGDVTVFVPGAASSFRSRLKISDFSGRQEHEVFRSLVQRLTAAGVPFGTGFRCPLLHMAAPTPEDPLPDAERLTRAVREATGAERVEIPFAVMKDLPERLRQNGFAVRVPGRLEGNSFRCMGLRGPGRARIAGCAVDIGTTTVSAALADLEDGRILARGSCGNGQIQFGADVISRIIAQGKSGGRERLRSAIVDETLNPLLERLCREAGVERENLLHLAVAANTTMNHLLLGLDAEPVRTEPYVPGFLGWEGLQAGDLALWANPLAPVELAPNLGSYVGGDITAGTLASLLWDRDEMTLMIDLGTNGEIVLGNREFCMSCACSAGPAFEGGDLSCGMRASDGAIEHLELDDALEPTLQVIGGGQPLGLCGSGMIDAAAQLFLRGAIDARGRFVRRSSRIRRDAHGMGRFVLAEATDRTREVSLTEVDLDNFIRAKGAVYAAVDTLLESVGMEPEGIDRILVAGGIGGGIRTENAVRIGLFPDVEPEKFTCIGNASLLGAYAMTVSDAAARRCREIAERMTYLELSTCPGYLDAFVAACFLPHTDARRFPSLRK